MNLPARLLAAALALCTLASPVAAGAAGHRRAPAHHAGPSYPMKADDFRKLMEKRIDGVRGTIDKKLDRHGVTPDRKKAIHRIFDEVSKDLRAEIDWAAADGTVTQAEADKVKTLTTGLRARVRERLRAEKNPRLKEKLDRDEATKKDHAAKAAAQKKAAPADPPHGDGAAAKTAATKTAAAKTAAAKPKAKGAKPKTGHDAGPTKTAKAPEKKHKPEAPASGADL
jgi:hypothetical protein